MLLGLDIGSSSIKAALVDAQTGKCIHTATAPQEEMEIQALRAGWAEQDPDLWWKYVVEAIAKLKKLYPAELAAVRAIGISYQMHGLVCIDNSGKPVRSSIIWCDSRAVDYGVKAFDSLGHSWCLEHLLNSPGNFTASKLKWVKENEPEIYKSVKHFMLPGDYIAYRLTGEIATTNTGLSEGILWDFKSGKISSEVLSEYGIPVSLASPLKPVFSEQGRVGNSVAELLGLPSGIPVSYRAGDQPNNAFSLNVLNPGETAATAGTSGVIYAVTDKIAYDPQSRVNTFLHVNHTDTQQRNGILLCINGTGVLNSWLRKNLHSGSAFSYEQMNDMARRIPVGSDGLVFYPFGNGAERILENKNPGACLNGLDLNRHQQAHLMRAAQEGIVFAMKYGFEILQDMGTRTRVVRAGLSNMFLSPVFREAFVNTLEVPVELYDTNGAAGAAIGAGVGAKVFGSFEEAFHGLQPLREERPDAMKIEAYRHAYQKWRNNFNA
jgi:xylulokinase